MVMTRMRSTAIIRFCCWQTSNWSRRIMSRHQMMAIGKCLMARQMKNWRRCTGFTIKIYWKVKFNNLSIHVIWILNQLSLSGINLSCPKVQSPSDVSQRNGRASIASAQSDSVDDSGVSEDNNSVVNSSSEHVSLQLLFDYISYWITCFFFI